MTVEQPVDENPSRPDMGGDAPDITNIARRLHVKWGYYRLVVLKRNGQVFQKNSLKAAVMASRRRCSERRSGATQSSPHNGKEFLTKRVDWKSA